MTLPAGALELENQYVGRAGAPTLGRVYVLLREPWRTGDRDRELALHLAFLAWYLLLEPPHHTGLEPTMVVAGELASIFDEARATLVPHGAASTDAEALYVIGLTFDGRGAYGHYFRAHAVLKDAYFGLDAICAAIAPLLTSR